ncbi:hypothetical protein KM043_008652 [Ampulex compressa]|nr:hypothetical protein KM043_008652 [Ampulex compressa]
MSQQFQPTSTQQWRKTTFYRSRWQYEGLKWLTGYPVSPACRFFKRLLYLRVFNKQLTSIDAIRNNRDDDRVIRSSPKIL